MASGNVFNPVSVVDDVRNLDGAVRVYAAKDGVQERDVLDDEINAVDIDPITDVVWVLYKEEDARAGELLDCASESEGE